MHLDIPASSRLLGPLVDHRQYLYPPMEAGLLGFRASAGSVANLGSAGAGPARRVCRHFPQTDRERGTADGSPSTPSLLFWLVTGREMAYDDSTCQGRGCGRRKAHVKRPGRLRPRSCHGLAVPQDSRLWSLETTVLPTCQRQQAHSERQRPRWLEPERSGAQPSAAPGASGLCSRALSAVRKP